jgi:hypothetical protein
MKPDKHIERRIVIGLIVSDTYIREVSRMWDIRILQSNMAQTLAGWCMEYFERYEKAPGKDIEGIYLQKLKAGLNKEVAEDIEEDILPDLSDEYDRTHFNVQYLMDQTKQYFRERNLSLFADQITGMLSQGDLVEAEAIASEYRPLEEGAENDVDLSSSDSDARIELAFSLAELPTVTYPGPLGGFLNHQLIRGGFIAFLGSEKRGKTWILMDLSIRACRQGANVAFFQAGDMTEDQQLRRICISLAKKSDKSKYCKPIRVPVLDCGRNFNDECDREGRKGYGCINPKTEANQAYSYIKSVAGKSHEAIEELIDKHGKDYKPCGMYNCPDFVGSVWFEKTKQVKPLTAKEAQRVRQEFFKPKGKVIKRKRGRYKLSTYYNGTLSIKEIRAVLDRWERQDNFVPDVVLIDYMDLLTDPTNEFRHKQNEIWKGGRRISQERHCLVITATQADANSYDQDTLNLKNFSEDKRKYSHVTAFYGLNQDQKGIEKRLGILRINELMVRDDEGGSGRQVCILQCLQQGRPFTGSFLDKTPKRRKEDK